MKTKKYTILFDDYIAIPNSIGFPEGFFDKIDASLNASGLLMFMMTLNLDEIPYITLKERFGVGRRGLPKAINELIEKGLIKEID